MRAIRVAAATGPMPGDRAQQPGDLGEPFGPGQQSTDLGIPVRNLRIEPLQMSLDVRAHGGLAAFAASGSLLLTHPDELIAALVRERQSLAIVLIVRGADRRQALCHGGEHAGIDPVGLGQHAGGTSEVPGAGRIHAGEGNARCCKGSAQLHIVASGCLEQHKRPSLA